MAFSKSAHHSRRGAAGSGIVPAIGSSMGMSLTNTRSAPARRTPALVSLGLILVYPLLSVPVQASIHNLVPRFGATEERIIAEGVIWLYAAIVLSIALFWERRTLASIGLRRPTLASLG